MLGEMRLMKNPITIIILFTIFFTSLIIACQPEEIINESPDDVENLNAIPYDSRIKLTWNEPDDDELVGIEITYEYGIIDIPIGINQALIEPLHNMVSYSFMVKTVNKDGYKSEGREISSTPVGDEPEHFDICDYLSNNWGGVTIRYDSVDDFMNECHIIEYYFDDMEMLQNIRPLVEDGHFYIGLNEYHSENDYNQAKVIPLVTTFDINGDAVIAKSTDELRNKGLVEGNIILSINGNDTDFYINQIMNMLPSSSIHETREKAYRLLFSYILSPNIDQYFEIPIYIDQSSVFLTYKDTESGNIESIVVDFESLSEYIPDDIFDMTMNNYWSIQREYNVDSTNVCISDNEFATLIEVNGENWFIYHPLSFIFDTGPGITNDLQCYLQFESQADFFVLDLRDSVGGGWHQTNIMLGIVDSSGSFNLPRQYWYNGQWSQYSTFRLEAIKDSQVPSIGETKKVYVWPNAICGSACDMFLYNIKNSDNDHIKIIGKPSAGRFIAVHTEDFLDYTVSIPVLSIMDEDNNHLEGTSIEPDYYFDVEPIHYQSADNIFMEYIDFISSNDL
jgi:hypothetical protein